MDLHQGLSQFLQVLVHKDLQDPRRVLQGISTHCHRLLRDLNLSKPLVLRVQACIPDVVVLIVPHLRGYHTQITHLDHEPLQDHQFQRGYLRRHLPLNQTILCSAIRPSRLKGEYYLKLTCIPLLK